MLLEEYDDLIILYTVLEIDDTNIDAIMNKVTALEYLGQYQEGQNLLNQVIEISDSRIKENGKDAEAYYNKSRVYYQLRKYDESLEFIKKAIEIDSKQDKFYDFQSTIFSYMGRFEDALASMDKAIEIASDNAEHLVNKGYILEKMSIFEDALACFDKAIAINPNYIDAMIGKSQVLKLMNKGDEAIDVLNQALELNPQNIYVYYNLAEMYMKKEDKDNHYKKIIELSDSKLAKHNSPFYLIHKAYALQYMEEYEKSIEILNELLNINEKNYRYHYCLVVNYYSLDNFEQALVTNEKIRQLKPDYVSYHISNVHILDGQAKYDEL